MRAVCIIVTLTLTAFAMLLPGCDKILLGEDESIISLEENLQPPPLLDDGWQVSDLASENIDVTRIQRLVGSIYESPDNIHSFLIVRNNKLVLETYYTGWHRDRVHALRSVSKTFVSTLTGIASGQGYFSPDQRVADFFPEYAEMFNEEKRNIKIQHLLTMTAGFKWDEKTYDGDDPRNDEYAFDTNDHRFDYLFSKEMVSTPGEIFVYNSSLPVVESAIIHKTTGMHAHRFADEHLFQPLGITNYFWRTNHDDGHVNAIGPLFLTPRDMAKLGQLFLDSGQWKGQQIVSRQWVKEATSTLIGNEASADGYGYHWWTARYSISNKAVRVYFARGSGGQYIFVVPEVNAVVAFTSGNYPPRNQSKPVNLLIKAIIPAMME
jgi:CubicO group peptidase (beta-lactamase class C family)